MSKRVKWSVAGGVLLVVAAIGGLTAMKGKNKPVEVRTEQVTINAGIPLFRTARLSGGSASMFARAMWVCSSHQSTCSVRSPSTGTVPSA